MSTLPTKLAWPGDLSFFEDFMAAWRETNGFGSKGFQETTIGFTDLSIVYLESLILPILFVGSGTTDKWLGAGMCKTRSYIPKWALTQKFRKVRTERKIFCSIWSRQVSSASPSFCFATLAKSRFPFIGNEQYPALRSNKVAPKWHTDWLTQILIFYAIMKWIQEPMNHFLQWDAKTKRPNGVT